MSELHILAHVIASSIAGRRAKSGNCQADDEETTEIAAYLRVSINLG